MPTTQSSFPDLDLSLWGPSRNTLHTCARLLGKVRAALTPRYKHWSNISLRVSGAGLTTTPVPVAARDKSVELELDCTRHQILLRSSTGERQAVALSGQPPAVLCAQVLDALDGMQVRPPLDQSLFAGTEDAVYDRARIEAFWQALARIDLVFKDVKGGLRQETSPVQLWPHHFDLAFLWFSGNRVPDRDPDDEESADEQMNFGFSTGDEAIPEPYFYITAYPLPAGLPQTELPAGAYWETVAFQGAVMKYKELVHADDPHAMLSRFLTTVQQAGAALMIKK